MNLIHKAIKKTYSLTRYTLNDLFKPSIKLKGNNILLFHGIDLVGNCKINSRFLSKSTFEDLVLMLKQQCNFISVNDYFTSNFNNNKPNIILTFDDGYKNNLTYLLPILEKYSIPASIYITTVSTVGYKMLWTDCLNLSAYINQTPFELFDERFVHVGKREYKSTLSGMYLIDIAKQRDWSFKQEMMKKLPGANQIKLNVNLELYWKLLSPIDINTLAKSPLITIGSHAQLHNCLNKCSHAMAMEELIISKKYLENIIQKEIDELAYPHGDYTNQLAIDAYELGYHKQLLVNFLTEKSKSFPFLKERFNSNPHISNYNQLFCIAKGKYF